MIKGQIDVNTVKLQPGDGVSIENESKIQVRVDKETEFLMFDLK